MDGKLMQSAVARAVMLGVPLTAHIDLTYRCNERCLHCYLDHGAGPELELNEVARILGQLAKAGTLFLTISGGEVFLRNDVLEILAIARRLQFSVRIKSNGTLIDSAISCRLHHLGVDAIDISIYAADETVHDAVTGLQGSLRRSVQAVKCLKDASVRVRVTSVLLRENADSLAGLQQFCNDLGVPFNLDPTITPRIDGDRSVLTHQGDYTRLRMLFPEFDLTSRATEACDSSTVDAIDVPCSAGHAHVYINPWGQVFPCVQFPFFCGDLRSQSFESIWRKSKQLASVRAVRSRDLPFCSACLLANQCSRCPGLALMDGDLFGRSPIDCRKAEARTGRRVATV